MNETKRIVRFDPEAALHLARIALVNNRANLTLGDTARISFERYRVQTRRIGGKHDGEVQP